MTEISPKPDELLQKLNELASDWGGVILWLIICAAAKISNANKTQKQTRSEMISEIVFVFFGGILAYLTIKDYKNLVWKWLIISAGAAGGADIMKWLGFNIKDILDIAGTVIKNKIKKIK